MPTTEQPVTELPEHQTLHANDRCDSCGARAYASAEITIGVDEEGAIMFGHLLFCAHHFNRFGPKIKQVAASFVDETRFVKG